MKKVQNQHYNIQLENVQWFVTPPHIGDPIPWRVMFEKVIGY